MTGEDWDAAAARRIADGTSTCRPLPEEPDHETRRAWQGLRDQVGGYAEDAMAYIAVLPDHTLRALIHHFKGGRL